MAWFTTPSAGGDLLVGLELDDRGLGAGAEVPVGRADVVAEGREPLLQHGDVGAGRAFLEGRARASVVVVDDVGVVTVVVTVATSPPDDPLPVGNPSPGSIASSNAHVAIARTTMTRPRLF